MSIIKPIDVNFKLVLKTFPKDKRNKMTKKKEKEEEQWGKKFLGTKKEE